MNPLLSVLLWHMGRQAHGLEPAPMPADFHDHVMNHPTFSGWQGGAIPGPQPQNPLAQLIAALGTMPRGNPGVIPPGGGDPFAPRQLLPLQPAPGMGGALAPYMPAMTPRGPIRM